MTTAVTADDLGMWTEDGHELPEVVAFDFLHRMYVGADDMPLDAETVDALGFDSTLRDVRYPSYLGGGANGGHIVLDGNGLHLRPGTRELRLTALRRVFVAGYLLEQNEIEQATYDRVNDEATAILGVERCERLSSLCTGEHWSSADMVRCSLDDDCLTTVLNRLDHEEW